MGPRSDYLQAQHATVLYVTLKPPCIDTYAITQEPVTSAEGKPFPLPGVCSGKQ